MRLRNLLFINLAICFLTSIINPLAIAATATTSAKKGTTPQPSMPWYTIRTKHITPPPFHAIQLYGPINTEIIAGAPKQCVELVGDAQTLRYLVVTVNNGILNVSKYKVTRKKNSLANRAPILVRIHVPYVDSITASGAGTLNACHLCGPLNLNLNGDLKGNLSGNNVELCDFKIAGAASVSMSGVHTNQMNLIHDGPGKISLQGIINAPVIRQSGTGSISLYWVNSPTITVYGSGCGKIFLAGTTCTLKAFLSNVSCLDAKFLHAIRGYVKTCDYAVAEVWVRDSLSTWARGDSSIYYFKDPTFISKNMEPPAVVLRMTGIQPICCPKYSL